MPQQILPQNGQSDGNLDTERRTARAEITGRTDRDNTFLRALRDKHGVHLLQYAIGLTAGDDRRAEDIVQEALIRAWQHVGKLTAYPEMARPWLFKVVRNLAIDGHRARQSRPLETKGTALEHVAGPDAFGAVLTRSVVRQAMGELTYRHREVLVYRYFLDCSVEETATELEIAIGTVKSRSVHALRALRKALEQHDFAR
ncbi:sigma-70 family RNA polymerase sigma factor [Streptomyces sp. NPDC087659]|uniref:sigma-70 family RNA polymerase sigma factor n=1 Tax=Streptomyces sp. NPDC087659 TaxID=3365801 RepID=UPI0037FF7732